MHSDDIISIIVPVYNAEKYINLCLESIINQTYKNWELILIDDGSTDNSRCICEEWVKKDKRIYLYSQNNRGAGCARNRGIDLCNTKWITFIDADDTIQPTYLENFLCSELSDQSISVQGFQRISPKGDKLGEEKNFSNRIYKDKDIVNSFSREWLLDYGQTVGKLYPSHLIKSLGIKFPTNYKLSEDHCFFLSVLPYVKCIVMRSGTLYNYIDWNNGQNITSKKFPPDELWTRFISLSDTYRMIMSTFDIKDVNVINWLQYFAFTGSISLYIQSIIKLKKCDRTQYFDRLKERKDDIIRYFFPKSVKGKLMKHLLLLFPPKVLSFIL